MLAPGEFSKLAFKKKAILFDSAPTLFDPGAFKPSILQQQAAEAAMNSGRFTGALRGALEGGLVSGAGLGLAGAGPRTTSLGALGGAGIGAMHGWDVGGGLARNKYLSGLEEKYLAEQAARRGSATGMHESVTNALRRGGEAMSSAATEASSLAGKARAGLSEMAGKLPPGALSKGLLGAGAGLGAYGLYNLLGGGAHKQAMDKQAELGPKLVAGGLGLGALGAYGLSGGNG